MIAGRLPRVKPFFARDPKFVAIKNASAARKRPRYPAIEMTGGITTK